MLVRVVLATGLICLLGACAPLPPSPSNAALVTQVRATESAFATTMVQRDFSAFASFIADDAVFLNGGHPLRGKAAILDHWKRFYTMPAAPFSWAPETVEVLDSGMLAQSIGPVRDPAGVLFARFYSTWRREPSGQWKIVLDNGYDACACAQAGSGATADAADAVPAALPVPIKP